MLYNEIKEILLDESRVLTQDEASKILAFWRSNPRYYHSFLRNKNASIQLMKYAGFDEEQECHVFEHTKVKVLAPSIAKKFLQINYSCIGVNFLETISDLSFNNEDEKCDIYAWPYLDETFTCVTSYNLVQEIIQNFHFVFNFKEDTSGRMFANLLGNFVNNPADSALFAASSFNISMFIRPEDVRSSISLHDALSVYAFSEHHFEWMEATDYGLFRKMFIAYVSSVRAFKREFIRDLEKEKGIYPC